MSFDFFCRLGIGIVSLQQKETATIMGLFDRVSRVIRSNLNAAVSSAEDPAKVLDQAIIDMQEDLMQMRPGGGRGDRNPEAGSSNSTTRPSLRPTPGNSGRS